MGETAYRFRRELPPFAALISFEAAARLNSFTAAAAELCVTQPAVSRQIRDLEKLLGAKLFRRNYRSVELTPEGEDLAYTVSRSFGHLAKAIDKIRTRNDSDELVLSSLVSFSNLWLTPRLSQYKAEFPHVKIRIMTQDKDFDLAKGKVDIALRYGNGSWADGSATLLFPDELFPVCSPSYVSACGNITGVTDLCHHRIIDYSREGTTWTGWDEWIKNCGGIDAKLAVDTHYGSYTDAVTAAVEGQGVLLGWRSLVGQHLETGRLVKMGTAAMRTSDGHYAVVPDTSADRPVVRSFTEWLLKLAK